MLFPDEALALLREARYDPAACRGFSRQASAFLWSDELLHHVRRICSVNDSRADLYLLTFRSSQIQGEPIEELRGPWDQLRQANPEWPGFKEERYSSQLGHSLKRQQQIARLLPTSVCILMGILLLLPCILLMVAVPIGVHITALNFGKASHIRWVWIGLGMQGVGIVFWESLFIISERFGQVSAKWNEGNPLGSGDPSLAFVKRLLLFTNQLWGVGLFLLLMDGGVHLRGYCYVYLFYAIPALLILLLRWKAWTRGEVVFLRWGWAPIIAVGLPLLLPVLIEMGLVRVLM
jgi:hypothetical protein